MASRAKTKPTTRQRKPAGASAPDPIFRQMSLHWTAWWWFIAATMERRKAEKRCPDNCGVEHAGERFITPAGVKAWARVLAETIRKGTGRGAIARAALKALDADKTRLLSELERQEKKAERAGLTTAIKEQSIAIREHDRYMRRLIRSRPRTLTGLRAFARYIEAMAPVIGLWEAGGRDGETLFSTVTAALMGKAVTRDAPAPKEHAALMAKVERHARVFADRRAKIAGSTP